MKRILALAIVIALGAGAANAEAAYCQDPTTHKRIGCKTVPAAASTPTKTVAATKPTEPAYPAPKTKPSMFAGMMKPKAASTAPMQSPTRMASSTGMATGHPVCKVGVSIPCGKSCISKDKVCHKPA